MSEVLFPLTGAVGSLLMSRSPISFPLDALLSGVC